MLSPERYRRLNPLVKDPEYDTFGDLESFDRDSLNETMKDYARTDPATRIQHARNSFERAFYSAKVLLTVCDEAAIVIFCC